MPSGGWDFRWGLEIRKQTKKPKPVWKSTSEHHSEVVVSLLFWEFQFKGLKMSSWQQGSCGKIGGEAKLLPLLCLPARAEGVPWCFSHCQEPLSPSVPSAEDAVVALPVMVVVWRCRGGTECFPLLCIGSFQAVYGQVRASFTTVSYKCSEISVN